MTYFGAGRRKNYVLSYC